MDESIRTVDITGRAVRGGKRHFKPMAEKLEEKRLAEEKVTALEIDRRSIEEQFLTPRAETFVKTEEIKEIEERVKVWLSLGYPIHLIGPTGCGKTMLAVYVASQIGNPTVWLNGDESMTSSNLVGGYGKQIEERYYDRFIHKVYKSRESVEPGWVDNPLTLACKYGYTLVYNEFSRAKAEANNVLLSVLEEGVLELPTKFGEERYIKVHPNFNVIMTSNSIEYAGVFSPQDALLDRMIGIHMDYYGFDTEVAVVKAHCNIPDEEARKVVSVVREIRDKLPEVQKPGTRACIQIAQGLQAWNGYTPDSYKRMCFDVIGNKAKVFEEQVKMHSLIDEIIGSAKEGKKPEITNGNS